MRLEHFELSPSSETLVAVVLGAVLATISGLIATQFEAYLHRRERHRDAALLIGELLTTLQTLLVNADRTRAIGDPYGPVTIRMLRSARRELDLYDRHRELLYDLRDAGLRRAVHSLIVRLAMPLDGILDASDALSADPHGPATAHLREARGPAFDFLMQISGDLGSLVQRLGVIAHHRFEPYGEPAPPPTPFLGRTDG